MITNTNPPGSFGRSARYPNRISRFSSIPKRFSSENIDEIEGIVDNLGAFIFVYLYLSSVVCCTRVDDDTACEHLYLFYSNIA